MRTTNSLKNVIVAALMNIISIIVGFIAQKIFIDTLGNEYLGLNGLFNNILSILAVVELGFGSSIIYNLYKPIYEKDESKINVLMSFYKKTYRTISLVILALGIFVLPFLKYIIGEINIKESVYFLFSLALFDIVASYLLTYKRSILYADQKTYIINIVHIGYIILLNSFQIFFLYLTKNYILYLLIKILFRILENIVLTVIANKKYPFITKKEHEKLDKETKDDILKKVKGLLFHRIGGSLVLGTDNIIISNICGVVTVGLYSNYNMIINAVNNLLGQVFDSLTATIGNLLIEKNISKSYNTYKNMLFFNSWIYSFSGTCILCLIEPFISIWIGSEYVLPRIVSIVLIINFYIQGMRKTNAKFKEAAGIFYEDRFVPLIEAGINIIASIIFAKLFGLVGVFIGTFLSSLALYLYSYPELVYKRLFNKRYINFILIHLKYLLISFIEITITYLIVININMQNIFITLLTRLIVCLLLPNLLYIVIFFKSTEFMYYTNLIKIIFSRILRRKYNEK